MTKVITGRAVGPALVDALGLPKRTVWFELRVHCDEVVSCVCEFYPEFDPRRLESVLQSYELVRRQPPQVLELSESAGCSEEFRSEFNRWLLEQFGTIGEMV